MSANDVLKTIKDKKTKQVVEVLFNCKMIPQSQLDSDPDYTTDEYNVAKYLGPIKDSIIAFVIGTVANHNIPITAPNNKAINGDGGESTNIVIVTDLNKYIIDNGIGFLTFPPSHPNPTVPIIFVTKPSATTGMCIVSPKTSNTPKTPRPKDLINPLFCQ